MGNTDTDTITIATRKEVPNNAVRGGMSDAVIDAKTGESIIVRWFQRDGARVYSCFARRTSDAESVLLGSASSTYGRSPGYGLGPHWVGIPGPEAARILSAAGVSVHGFYRHQVTEMCGGA